MSACCSLGVSLQKFWPSDEKLLQLINYSLSFQRAQLHFPRSYLWQLTLINGSMNSFCVSGEEWMPWMLQACSRVELGAWSAPLTPTGLLTHLCLLGQGIPQNILCWRIRKVARHSEYPGDLSAGQRKGKVAEELHVVIFFVKWLLRHLSTCPRVAACEHVSPNCPVQQGYRIDRQIWAVGSHQHKTWCLQQLEMKCHPVCKRCLLESILSE